MIHGTDGCDRSTVGSQCRESKEGFFDFSAVHFTVSTARPPPTAKIISAFSTSGQLRSLSAFSKVASPPYHKESVKVMEFLTALIMLFSAFSSAVRPPIITAEEPKSLHMEGIDA